MDSRLPGSVSGAQICGHYDLNPAKFGQVDNLVVHASCFGDQSEVDNGVNVSLSARHEGYSLAGGFTAGKTVTDACFVVDSLRSTSVVSARRGLRARSSSSGA